MHLFMVPEIFNFANQPKLNKCFRLNHWFNRFNFFTHPLAESLNFHMKLSNARSHDSKCDKIAVKVNYPQNVKSMKNQEVLDFGKNGF